MKSSALVPCFLAAMLVPALAVASPAVALSQPSRELAKAAAHGDCDTAVRLANEDLKSNDAQAIFLAGRMVAEGVCVPTDVPGATAYFARAAAQGFSAAQVDYGVQIGLGEGAQQSYEQAGNLCHKGGLEPAPGGSPSWYSLGYACTVRGLVSRQLRQSLPRGAFVPGTGIARVSFNPATGVMQIRSLPRVASNGDTTTGSYLPQPLFDAKATIDKAWKDALTAVPKPETARLENLGMEFTLDLDMTIEGGTGSRVTGKQLQAGALMPGEVHPVMNAPH